MRITGAGKVYIETARKIFDLEYQMENSFSSIAGNRAGRLIVSAASYRAASMISTVAKRFQSIHPGMHMVVREETTGELVEAWSAASMI